MSTLRATPVGGPVVTRGTVTLAVLGGIGLALLAWRFLFGIGAVSNLSDGYPWGIWIAFDVVVGTALATGGYAVALLVYVLNRGRYHPLVRSALLTSALGYTLGAVGVVIDLGRFWSVWKVPVLFWRWNLSSVLLEVALCIMLYVAVLWVEVSPAFLERWQESRRSGLRRFAARVRPGLERALPWIIALGLLLPTLHQSSLGTLMLLSGQKLHPLWSTPLLPLLFLVSCVGMGYAAVVIENLLASRAFRRPAETPLLAGLSTAVVWTLFVYLWVRVVDVVARGKLPLVLEGSGYSLLFVAELALFAAPMVLLLRRRRREDPGYLFRAAMLIVFGGTLYRLSTFLFAFRPGRGWSYFPALPELMITVGLVALEILAYVLIVKHFPILRGEPEPAPLADGRIHAWARAS